MIKVGQLELSKAVTRAPDGFHLTIPAIGSDARLFFRPMTVTEYSRLIPVVEIREEV
jgi:hypothetical protein